MRHRTILITCFFIYLSLLSCVAIETGNISTTPTVTFTNTPIATATPTPTSTPLATKNKVVPSITVSPGSSIAIIQSDDPNSTPEVIIYSKPKGRPTRLPKPTLSPKQQNAVATAWAFVGDKASNLRFTRIHPGNPLIVDFKQTYQGIPVEGAYISVYIYRNKPSTSLDNLQIDVELPSITPTVTLSEAIAITAKHIDIEGEYTLKDRRFIVYDVPYNGKGDKYVLAWHVVLDSMCPFGFWVAYINAYTGDILNFGYGGPFTSSSIKLPSECPEPARVPKPTPIPAP